MGSGDEDGILFLCTRYVDGADLRTVLRQEGRLDPERALDLVEQVAAALDAAHRAGLVHRDIKPGNILVEAKDGAERAYICDFGLARHVSSVSSLTSDRGFVGTIDYVPPEQIESGTVDARADVYSLGCVLYECLAGSRPFDRDSELSVLFAHLNDPPPRVTDIRPELPAALDPVFAHALAKAPSERYGTCGELARVARAGLRGKTIAPRRRPGRRALVLAVGALAAAGVAIAAVLTIGGSRNQAHAAPLRLRPSSVNLMDARTHRLVGHVSVGVRTDVADTAWDVVFTNSSAWVLLYGKQRLVRVDPAKREAAQTVRLPWYASAVAADGRSLWVAQDGGNALWKLDGRSGKVLERIALQGGNSEGGLAAAAGSLWLASGSGLVRVDPRSGRIVHRFPIAGTSGGMHVVAADGAVWAARPGSGVVVKIDPQADRVAHTAPLHGWISDLVVGGGSVWVSIVPDGQVYRLSENDLSVRGSASGGSDPERLSFGGGSLWIADASGNRVSRLGEVATRLATVRVAGAVPATAAYHNGLVWVGAAPQLPPLPPIHGQELRVVGGGVAYDPAHNGLWDDQVLYATCAKLLDYPDTSGSAGGRLQPEIAAAMPSVSADGRTYTFQIRNGFRFSPPSNEPVTAQTFRHTIERQIATTQRDPGLERYVADIVGARAFYAGRARHVAGIVVHGDRLSITLTRPAGDFATRMAMPRFCPVPLSTPLRGGGDRPLPSAGPYYVL
jgi:serine/threonine-protein kinase